MLELKNIVEKSINKREDTINHKHKIEITNLLNFKKLQTSVKESNVEKGAQKLKDKFYESNLLHNTVNSNNLDESFGMQKKKRKKLSKIKRLSLAKMYRKPALKKTNETLTRALSGNINLSIRKNSYSKKLETWENDLKVTRSTKVLEKEFVNSNNSQDKSDILLNSKSNIRLFRSLSPSNKPLYKSFLDGEISALQMNLGPLIKFKRSHRRSPKNILRVRPNLSQSSSFIGMDSILKKNSIKAVSPQNHRLLKEKRLGARRLLSMPFVRSPKDKKIDMSDIKLNGFALKKKSKKNKKT